MLTANDFLKNRACRAYNYTVLPRSFPLLQSEARSFSIYKKSRPRLNADLMLNLQLSKLPCRR